MKSVMILFILFIVMPVKAGIDYSLCSHFLGLELSGITINPANYVDVKRSFELKSKKTENIISENAKELETYVTELDKNHLFEVKVLRDASRKIIGITTGTGKKWKDYYKDQQYYFAIEKMNDVLFQFSNKKVPEVLVMKDPKLDPLIESNWELKKISEFSSDQLKTLGLTEKSRKKLLESWGSDFKISTAFYDKYKSHVTKYPRPVSFGYEAEFEFVNDKCFIKKFNNQVYDPKTKKLSTQDLFDSQDCVGIHLSFKQCDESAGSCKIVFEKIDERLKSIALRGARGEIKLGEEVALGIGDLLFQGLKHLDHTCRRFLQFKPPEESLFKRIFRKGAARGI